MQTHHPADRAATKLPTILFLVVTVLVLAAIGFAGWIMASYWGHITV